MADLGTPSVSSALGLGTADSLINQDITAGKQAATTIKGRDDDMAGILKNLSEQKFDKPPPLLGQHTDQVLGELGLSGGEIADLRSRKVV